MPLMDILKQITDPIKKVLLKSPVHNLISQHATVISFTERQSGNDISITADFFRDEDLVYLLVDKQDNRLTNLISGAPVKIFLEGMKYHGWAEILPEKKDFVQVLAHNPKAQSILIENDDILSDHDNIQKENRIEKIADTYTLVKVKLSR